MKAKTKPEKATALQAVIPFPKPLLLSASRLRNYAKSKLSMVTVREKLKEAERLLAAEGAEIERLLASGAKVEDD